VKIIRPKNWNEFQHYKDRSPIWIKLHKRLLDDFDFQSMPVASRALAPMMWLLASEYENGEIPSETRKIAFRLRMTLEELAQAFEPLLRRGFFEIIGEDDLSDSGTLAERYQDSIPEKENKGENKLETEVVSDLQSDPPIPERPKAKKKAARAAYPSDFEEFWKAYPTDPIMSKKAAAAHWAKLTSDDQSAAKAAIPGFKAFCSKDKTYRPVHAERFLSQRRFDGFSGGSTVLNFEPKAREAENAANQKWEAELEAARQRQGA
jgi:hypothetical protein